MSSPKELEHKISPESGRVHDRAPKRTLGRLIDAQRNQPLADKLWVKHENPYLEKSLQLQEHLFTLSQCQTSAWEKFLSVEQPIVVEVGCYYGKNITHMAKENPHLFFIGLEITYKRAVKSAQRLKKLGLSNAAIVMARAQEFFIDFPKSCQGVCVFFPDPWPKERQKKHRLVGEDFARLLKQKLTPGGFFWLKTDSLPYAEYAKQALFLGGFVARTSEVVLPQCLATAPDVLQGEPLRTAFEELFHGQGLPTYASVWQWQETPGATKQPISSGDLNHAQK